MKTITFKTNLECGGCVARITPLMNENSEIKDWSVDLDDVDKRLTVTSSLPHESVIKILEKAGFSASPLLNA